MQKGKVGSKGEIFPPKEIREKLGLRPGTVIDIEVENDRLIVRPVPKVKDLLKESAQIEITLEEFHKFRRERPGGERYITLMPFPSSHSSRRIPS